MLSMMLGELLPSSRKQLWDGGIVISILDTGKLRLRGLVMQGLPAASPFPWVPTSPECPALALHQPGHISHTPASSL